MNIKAIGENIDKILKARGMTRVELSNASGLSQMNISRHIKEGTSNLSYIARYAESLGCTISDLTEGVTDPERFVLNEDITGRYPYNLAFAVFTNPWNRKEESENVRENVYRVYIPGLLAAVADLTEREQKVIEDRYMHHMTLEQCGYHFNVTRERIRQVEARALRKLRHPYSSKHWLLDTMDKAREAQEELSRIELENVRLKNYIESHCPESKMACDNKPEDEHPVSVSIDELELSVRSFNCLRRAGINSTADLEGFTVERLMKVRNLGRKSIDEIIMRLKDYGIEIKSEGDGE